MPKLKLRDITLMVSILLMGIILGGIVYSHIVYFPVYLSALPDSSVLVNGPYALHEGRFWLLIHPLGDSLADHLARAELENSRAPKTHRYSSDHLRACDRCDEFVFRS